MLVTVPSYAKLNLDLRVLHRRTDNFHELRSIFQTISLKDTLRIEFDFAKRETQIDLSSSIDIADNLVVRAAKLLLEEIKVKAWVRFSLKKQIPMGAGLGGGSSNAAAVLLALPALAGKRVPMPELIRFAETLPDLAAYHVLVVSTGVHVSTAQAYQALNRDVTNALTSPASSPILREFQTISWNLADSRLEQLPLKNDFETVVFQQHPNLAAVVRKLRRAGATCAMMTGSGSAIFGIFSSQAEAQQAAQRFPAGQAFRVRFVNRAQYRQHWLRALGPAAEKSCFA